jgi:hypothetical protein
MVPKAQQEAVLRHYRRGQCQDMRPSPEWFAAAKMAVALVAQQEGKPMSKHQRELLAQQGERGEGNG